VPALVLVVVAVVVASSFGGVISSRIGNESMFSALRSEVRNVEQQNVKIQIADIRI
jgi:hypothetical protein